MEVSCKNCIYFVEDTDKQTGDDHDGHCHRYPPIYAGVIKEKRKKFNQFWFPIVQYEEWCGEWKGNENTEL